MGLIRKSGLGWDYFARNVPLHLLGDHSACFRSRPALGEGWYLVHFAVPPSTLDAGVAAVEKLLVRSLKRRA